MSAHAIPFEQLRNTDVGSVGGKNASLGEMISQLSAKGVRVPTGFATTADAYREFLAQDGLDKKINDLLDKLDADDTQALAICGTQIRKWIMDASFPAALNAAIAENYARLTDNSAAGTTFAVRSSATAEDLPDASFAGQQESFLNIHGLDNITHAIKEVFASLYNDRAISYRVHKGFVHADVALSAGVQQMVRSDIGCAGVMFTIDTESGFKDVAFITSSYGLGETVVQGAVNPDEFYVHKPLLALGKPAIVRRTMGSKLIKMVFSDATQAGKSTNTVDVDPAESDVYSLSDADILELGTYAMTIENHYGCPMDIEWGKNGLDGKLYILQARPETVKSQESLSNVTESYKLQKHSSVFVVCTTQSHCSGTLEISQFLALLARCKACRLTRFYPTQYPLDSHNDFQSSWRKCLALKYRHH